MAYKTTAHPTAKNKEPTMLLIVRWSCRDEEGLKVVVMKKMVLHSLVVVVTERTVNKRRRTMSVVVEDAIMVCLLEYIML